VRQHFNPIALVFLVCAAVLAAVPFWEDLGALFDIWNIRPEYSHGILIPPIAAFLVWRERGWLSTTRFTGSWIGVGIASCGLLLWGVGKLSTISTIVQYAFLIVLYGLVLALTGWAVFKRLWMPLLVLIFMVPLPAFFYSSLSLQLQLISSEIGVLLVRAFGISVFAEGNIIDLGAYQLQVAEACDGLRYLFPLMTLAFILAYFMRAPFWKRALLFLSSVPISILMNSIRIGVIGITVDRWGPAMAEGVLHDFQGWAVFMLSFVVMLVFAAFLLRIGRARGTTWRDGFDFDTSVAHSAVGGSTVSRRLPGSFMACAALLAFSAAMTFALPERSDLTPTRTSLANLPLELGAWSGRRDALERVYLDALRLDDYAMANYKRSGASSPVNLYVAYYDSQRTGESAHSPRSCLPGGGWEITSFEQRAVETDASGTLAVNRAVIELGDHRQLVYYWFQQRGRIVTNEYLVKWYIFWDALTRRRTDGALVRLTAFAPRQQDIAKVDAELTDFARQVYSVLPAYVPN
jgi:exosortase D (VPLPA-CTERM-specific)